MERSRWLAANGLEAEMFIVLPETNGGVNEPMSGNRDSWQSTSGNGDSPQIKVR